MAQEDFIEWKSSVRVADAFAEIQTILPPRDKLDVLPLHQPAW
jgi:hypothetical protein